jgi:hypothetical protein
MRRGLKIFMYLLFGFLTLITLSGYLTPFYYFWE